MCGLAIGAMRLHRNRERDGMMVHRLRGLLMAMLAAAGCLAPWALAQEAQRMARPFAMHEDADGKVSVSPDATVGNMAVDIYARIGGKVAGYSGDRELLIKGYEAILCNRNGAGAMAAHFAEDAIKAMSKDQRAKLKALEPESLTSLSIAVLAGLDGVAAEAIRADEALGPGVYQPAIAGMSLALDQCDFFGLEARL